MTYKALIVDFDGTAITNRIDAHPTQRVIDAIQKAKEKIFVCGATGRSIATARWVIQALKLTSPTIIADGTKIIEPITEEILWQAVMSKQTVEKILATARKYPYEILTDSQLSVFPSRKEYALQEESIVTIVEIPLKEKNRMIDALGHIPNTLLTISQIFGLSHFDIHIVSPDGTKANALNQLKKILNVQTEEIIGIGDGYNDLPLFEEVGLKVAMGNAPEELKAKADFITAHVDNDGLAETIEKFILT